MEKQKRKLKKRYIFCFCSLAVILAGYFIFLCAYSSHYTISIMVNGEADPGTVRVECSNDNTVKVGDIRQGRLADLANTVEVDLYSIGRGDVSVTVHYEDVYNIDENSDGSREKQIREPNSFESSFYVTLFGTIWCDTSDTFNGLWTFPLLMDLIMAVLIITFFLTFREKQKNGDFSYSMVTLGGAIFFLTVTLLLSLIYTVTERDYNVVMNVKNLMYYASNISIYFVYLTAIPLMLFCFLLAASNIWLVRHEGFRVQNLLGFLLGISVILGFILIYLLRNVIYTEEFSQEILFTVINSVLSFTFCYFESLLASTVVCALMSTKYKVNEPMDYIIILGCAIRKDGTPTPILRGRIDRALAFDKEQSEKWNKHTKFVPSGGQGSNEVISEAESMKRYLMEHGIPEENILKEDKSVNTYQNMKISKKVIKDDAGDLSDKHIAFSTTNYHVFRGYTLAKRLGMKVRGLSAKTKLYFFPNAFLREFVGLIFEQKLRHIFVVLVGVAFFALLYLTAVF